MIHYLHNFFFFSRSLLFGKKPLGRKKKQKKNKTKPPTPSQQMAFFSHFASRGPLFATALVGAGAGGLMMSYKKMNQEGGGERGGVVLGEGSEGSSSWGVGAGVWECVAGDW